VQHHRKGLRAALATLGGRRRKLSPPAALVASCVSLLGCTNATRYVPLSPAAVRSGAEQVDRHGVGHVVDRDGDSHDVSRTTYLHVDGNREVGLGDLLEACETPRASAESRTCLLDDPAVKWQLPMSHRVVDTAAITTWGVVGAMTGALVIGNYECFGPGCSTGAKVAVGVSDGLVVLSTVALVALLRNFSVSSSCGPLAPPCMPREEIA
jgi:hypothetical protein